MIKKKFFFVVFYFIWPDSGKKCFVDTFIEILLNKRFELFNLLFELFAPVDLFVFSRKLQMWL